MLVRLSWNAQLWSSGTVLISILISFIMAEEERRRRMMEEMSKIMNKMSKDMGKLSKISEEMSKDMGKMSKIMEEMSLSSTTTTSTTTLPQNLIMEILSWVPAKSLVSSSSFKLVCKEWHALILDPHFVKMHLNRAINEGGGLICKSGNMLYQLHPPFNFEVGVPPPTTIAPTKLLADFDPLLLGSSFRLVGSINGLICLSINHDQTIILLNPSTRKFKILPEQPIDPPAAAAKQFLGEPCPFGVTYGFGCCYNSSTNKVDEYKVVRIAGFEGYVKDDEPSSIVAQCDDIYSMSSDSWRRMEPAGPAGIRDSYEIAFEQLGVFSNGALHWMGCPIPTIGYMGWDRIVSFDIRDEEFRQVPIPVSFFDPSFSMQAILLMNMRGCLGMIRSSTMDVDFLRVWVMKEYGIKESWTEEFVIRSSDSYPPRPRPLSDFFISFTSTAYVLKGDQILIEGLNRDTKLVLYGINGDRKLVLYGINERKIDGNFKMIGVPDEPDMFQVDYIETLVSLKSLLLPLSIN